jgi:hypothetical protein
LSIHLKEVSHIKRYTLLLILLSIAPSVNAQCCLISKAAALLEAGCSETRPAITDEALKPTERLNLVTFEFILPEVFESVLFKIEANNPIGLRTFNSQKVFDLYSGLSPPQFLA